ncbi:MAG: TAXI family TRAP transporter solute-binding subunit [Trueperaceae bacterium]|nr:TAXI family TRAP transporter solute-binding subunit [Trueperaceae bacterium]
MKLRKAALGLVVSTLLAVAGAGFAQTDLSIATGGTGGTYYPLGGGLAELISQHIEGYSAVAEVTGASVENSGLVSRGDSDMALALADTVVQAYRGTGDFENRQLSNLRALGSMYPNAVQIVTLADSNITSLSDLAGMRVSVGAPGSGTEVSAQTILNANGITYDDIDEQRLNFNETANALRDGQIDAGFWSVGPPTSSILDLATTRDVRILSLSDEEIANAQAESDVFAIYTMPAGTYPGQDEPVTTIGTPNVLIVAAEMDEQLAYDIVQMMFAYVGELREIHPAANSTTIEFSLGATPIPLHPGALRYYQEIGADIPDRLMMSAE